MPSSDPLDYIKRHIRWPWDRLRERHFSPRKNPRPIPPTGIFDAPYACIKINYSWVSHIIGVLETLRDLDSWVGTDEQQDLAIQEIDKLLAMLDTACPEEEIVTSFRFNSLCGMEYSNDNGETWNPVPGWSEFAEACFQGPPGQDGEDGEDGAQGPPGEDGAPGEDCDCPTDGGVGPQDPVEPDPGNPNQDKCDLASGLADFLSKKWAQHIGFLKAQFEASLIVYDVIENFIESFPVIITGVITTVMDFVESLTEVDFNELLRLNDFEFTEEMMCVIYCAFKRYPGAIGTAEVQEVLFNDLQPWLIARGLEGPLLTAFGPLFAAWIPLLNINEIMRRMHIWADKPGNCDLCEDCGCDPGEEQETTLYDGSQDVWSTAIVTYLGHSSRNFGSGTCILQLPEPVCITQIRVSHAGQSGTSWQQIQVFIDDAPYPIQADKQHTSCNTNNATSNVWVINPPIEGSQIKFVGTETAEGSTGNPAAPHVIHCAHVTHGVD